MSISLVASLPSTVNEAISKIENEAKSVESREEMEIAIGPFNVFHGVYQVPDGESEVGLGAKTSIPVVEERAVDKCDNLSFPEGTVSPSNLGKSMRATDFATADVAGSCDLILNELTVSDPLDELLSSSLEVLQWGDLFTWNAEVNHSPLPGYSIDEVSCSNHGPHTILDDWTIGETINQQMTETRGFSRVRPSVFPELNDDLVADAPILLKHFYDEVINQMGSLPINEKSAWRILNFPSAIVTLSQLTILKIPSHGIRHANLSNLYALIAVSAFHLSLNSKSFPEMEKPEGYWKRLSERTYDCAKFHLKLSLEEESAAPKKAKYKEQLMAAAAILATASKLSRRARLLHNIYAWMRIVSESTKTFHDEAPVLDLIGINDGWVTAQDHVPAHDQSQAGIASFRPAISSAEQLRKVYPEITLDNFLHLEPLQLHPDTTFHNIINDDMTDTNKDIHLATAIQDQEDILHD
ncbi:uncharacterized protein CCOS01_13528 [Colletotrichum costaricense]|uniref:Uncharacterized protein n=1 Tax=Colletotrichum costaricense TaxID=1209916 RepID=A0AAI9YLI7_9PEZI|nr:uncharacterized protein CCOS01_13528 [Colletotrichum costaricense]KAK1515335.1 hypothetical protein CCOS01_13528 [Colletotrichum costaricense]